MSVQFPMHLSGEQRQGGKGIFCMLGMLWQCMLGTMGAACAPSTRRAVPAARGTQHIQPVMGVNLCKSPSGGLD